MGAFENIIQKKPDQNMTNIYKQSICKIIIKKINNNNNIYGTGFFMKVSDAKKYLITNYHILSKNNINDDIEIEKYNQKTVKLNLNNRKIEYIPQPKDISIIEIKNNDEIYNDILFLDYDSNYNKGYKNIYKNARIFLIEGNTEFKSGRIINVNGFEFVHNISTEEGAYGSPIMLYNKNMNLIKVIGIHKKSDHDKKLNSGTFIGEIIKNEILNNNYIISEIVIKDDENVNKDIRIINSYEEYMREYCPSSEIMRELMNEVHIKQCEIRINNELIPFNYFYKFIQKGKYIIKYSFNNYLTNTNHIFCKCSSLTNINLSNFNTQNVKDICWMFY